MVAFGLAAWLTYQETGAISFADFFSMRVKVQNFVLFLAMVFLWHLIFSSFQLYNSHRLSPLRQEIYKILKGATVGNLIISLAAILLRIQMATPVFLILFSVMSTVLLVGSRLLLRQGLAWLRLHGRNLRFMLIAGTNPRAIEFARKIESPREAGYRILGFVDTEWDGLCDFRANGYRVVADFAGFPAYLRNNVVDEVIIALPLKSQYQQASQIVRHCEEQGIVCRYLSQIFHSRQAHLNKDYLEVEPVISHYAGAMEAWTFLGKRFMDIVISLLILVLLSPLFLLIALMIKRDSPGPVFFSQYRLGKNKRLFRLYKFRTMVRHAEEKMRELEHLNEVSGPVFKIKDDPRISRIGRFLRKTSIDELPQLVNVLKGDMSLVGPRPLPGRDYNGFSQDWHRRRFSVRPGITCLWQINGRSTVQFDKWMELDMEYIDHWSLTLDLKILLKTIPAVIKGSGAA